MFIKEIKWALQRAFRGYDERIEKGWGADQIIIDAMPGIKKFCERKLKEISNDEYNQKRIKIYQKTVKLINDVDEIRNWEEVAYYIGEYIGWYWD